MKNVKVMIGIQARSTSTRYPNKIEAILGDMSVLDHIIKACVGVTLYVSRYATNPRVNVSTLLCIPFNDKIKERFKDIIAIVEGPENDVLSRYVEIINQYNPDYIVRLTGDCPLIVEGLISKAIILAVKNSYDYLSNVDEDCRTAPDGYDVEVISKKMLLTAHELATDIKDREHVTTWIRRERPSWGKYGFIVGSLDRSGEKISLDTLEDEERIQFEYDRITNKTKKAILKYGKTNVHTFS